MPRPVSKRWLGREGDSNAKPPSSASHKPGPTANAVPAKPLASNTPIDNHWRQISKDWVVLHDAGFGSLVVPTGNGTAPIHRWFHFKEAYSRDLLKAVLDRLPESTSDELVLADPFSGVGTTLVSAAELVRSGVLGSVRGYGLEVNPFLQFVTSIKLHAASGGLSVSPTLGADVLACAKELKVRADQLPALSTFHNTRYFRPEHVSQIVQIRLAIERLELNEQARSLARMALAMTVEPAGKLRRDGRALRYEDREPLAPFEVFGRALSRVLDDLPTEQIDSAFEVVRATAATKSWKSVPNQSVDLVLFSPPYPNNIDYTEVYKTELWAMGFIEDAEQFRAQRHETLRSHPSVKFTRETRYSQSPRSEPVQKLLAPLLDGIPDDSRYAKPLARMISGYADDMLTVFDAAFEALRPGGHCVYIVGNSVHGGTDAPLMIASDVLLGALAELAGFEVTELHVARDLPRRRIDSEFVRESVVYLRRPVT